MIIDMTSEEGIGGVIELLEAARRIFKARRQYKKAKEVERTIAQYKQQQMEMPK